MVDIITTLKCGMGDTILFVLACCTVMAEAEPVPAANSQACSFSKSSKYMLPLPSLSHQRSCGDMMNFQ